MSNRLLIRRPIRRALASFCAPHGHRSLHAGDASTCPARKANVSIYAWATLSAIILIMCAVCVFQLSADLSGLQWDLGQQSRAYLVAVHMRIRVHRLPPRYEGPLTLVLVEGCALVLGGIRYLQVFVFFDLCLFRLSLAMSRHLPGRRNCHLGDGVHPPGCQ